MGKIPFSIVQEAVALLFTLGQRPDQDRYRYDTYGQGVQVAIEDLHMEDPVIRSYHQDGSVKQYVRDQRILRTEVTTNDVAWLGIGKAVENLPRLRKKQHSINENYLHIQQDILETFVDRGQLRQLSTATVTAAGKRIPGLKLDHPRPLALMHALLR